MIDDPVAAPIYRPADRAYSFPQVVKDQSGFRQQRKLGATGARNRRRHQARTISQARSKARRDQNRCLLTPTASSCTCHCEKARTSAPDLGRSECHHGASAFCHHLFLGLWRGLTAPSTLRLSCRVASCVFLCRDLAMIWWQQRPSLCLSVRGDGLELLHSRRERNSTVHTHLLAPLPPRNELGESVGVGGRG